MCICRLQEADERNFHAWAYRRFIVRLASISAHDEEQYAASLVDANFSNYSAWHARTTLLHAVHAAQPVMSLDQMLRGDEPLNAAESQQEQSRAGAGTRVQPGPSGMSVKHPSFI